MTLPPVWVVKQHGKHVLEPQKSDRAAKIPIFGPFKAVFRAQNEQQGLPGNMAEKWGHLGEKIDLRHFDQGSHFRGPACRNTRF